MPAVLLLTPPPRLPACFPPQVDWLLGRMLRDGVHFSHQAVGRLTSFCFGRGQPQVAFSLFKASKAPAAVGSCTSTGPKPPQRCLLILPACVFHSPAACLPHPCSCSLLRRRPPPRTAQTVREMGLLSIVEPAGADLAEQSAEEGEGHEDRGGGAAASTASVDLLASASGDEEDGEERARGGRHPQDRSSSQQAAYCYSRMIAACHKAR